MGALVKRIGGIVFWAGAAALAGIFVIVMVNGTWPEFFKPVQSLFATLNDYFGGFAIVVEGLIFLGPGLLLVKAGDALEVSQRRS